MAKWQCPECKRWFGAVQRGHMCAPGVSIDDHIAAAGPEFGPVYEKVAAHLETLDGDLIVDPVTSVVMFKNGPTVAMLRPMKKWTALSFALDRKVESKRFSRKVAEFQGKYNYVINLTDAAQIDDQVLEWLTDAFYIKGGRPGGDPMVPDDVDLDLDFDLDFDVDVDADAADF